MIFVVVFGLALLGGGVAAWRGVWRSWTVLPIFGTGVFAYIPAGLGILLMSLAFMTEVRVLAVPGLVFLALSGVLLIWQPKWFTPSWYRETEIAPMRSPPIRQLIRSSGGAGRAKKRDRQSTDGLILEGPATYLDKANRPVKIGGMITSARSGWLALSERGLSFTSDDRDRRLYGDNVELSIPLNEIRSFDIAAGNLRESLRGRDVRGILSMVRRLHLVTESGDYFFIPHRGVNRWRQTLAKRVGN
jgi:hypothetical protein